jgi:hypothetical protein
MADIAAICGVIEIHESREKGSVAFGLLCKYNTADPIHGGKAMPLNRIEGSPMVSSPTDRRNQKYGFESVDSMTVFFSKWIPETEIKDLVDRSESDFRPRKDSSEAETRLQRIQKAEFAIVRRLVHRNPPIL